jgi:hypothetical protein
MVFVHGFTSGEIRPEDIIPEFRPKNQKRDTETPRYLLLLDSEIGENQGIFARIGNLVALAGGHSDAGPFIEPVFFPIDLYETTPRHHEKHLHHVIMSVDVRYFAGRENSLRKVCHLRNFSRPDHHSLFDPPIVIYRFFSYFIQLYPDHRFLLRA